MNTIIEGDKQILTQSVRGDYTGRNNYFTAKDTLANSDSNRIIDYDLADEDAVYSDGETTFTIELLPSDTALVTRTRMYGDIVSVNKTDSTDTETVWMGSVKVLLTIRNDQDEATPETTPVIVLDASDFDDLDMLIKDDTSGSFIPINYSELKTALGMPQKLYVAKISQSSTNDPVVSEISNNYGYTPYTSFARTSAGLCTMLFNSNLTSYIEAQTIVVTLISRDSSSIDAYSQFYFSGNTGKFETVLTSDFSTNQDFLNHILKIEIYT